MTSNIPNPRTPVARFPDGFISPDWYRFFSQLPTSSSTTPVSTFSPISGISTPSVQTKTVGYTETSNDGFQVRLCNSASGFTVSLPTAIGNTAILTFKTISTGSIVLQGFAGQTIDGGTTATLSTRYTSVTLISDNANWWVI